MAGWTGKVEDMWMAGKVKMYTWRVTFPDDRSMLVDAPDAVGAKRVASACREEAGCKGLLPVALEAERTD